MTNPFHSCNLWALAPEFAEGVAELYHRACQSDGEVQPLAQTSGPDEIARSIIRQQGHVAVISITGPIDRTSIVGRLSGQLFVIGQDAIRCALDDALKDPSVRGILLSINSPGGVVTSGLAMYDTMQYISCDVSTLCIGQACSMGSFLLAGGAKGKRFSLPNSQIMIHQPSGGAKGQAADIEIQAKLILDLRKRLNTIYAQNTGQKLSVIEKAMDRDNFMTPVEAKEFGLIDEIVTNRLEIVK